MSIRISKKKIDEIMQTRLKKTTFSNFGTEEGAKWMGSPFCAQTRIRVCILNSYMTSYSKWWKYKKKISKPICTHAGYQKSSNWKHKESVLYLLCRFRLRFVHFLSSWRFLFRATLTSASIVVEFLIQLNFLRKDRDLYRFRDELQRD